MPANGALTYRHAVSTVDATKAAEKERTVWRRDESRSQNSKDAVGCR